MKVAEERTVRVVLYEGSEAEALGSEERLRTVSALLQGGFSVTSSSAGRLEEYVTDQPTLVLGAFMTSPPRATGLKVENIKGMEGDRIVGLAEAMRVETESAKQTAWKPWFPVIDYDRCTNCMQCLSFCLFGVYGVDSEKKIQVQNQDQCKTNCPACSRVCPEAAIMFPKYKAGPINGDAVSDGDLNREKMKIDISALLGGDVYELLRTRSDRAKSRFSLERDADKALKERQKCLAKLQEALDVPPEVMMSLPSPAEIQRKMAEASARSASLLGAGAGGANDHQAPAGSGGSREN